MPTDCWRAHACEVVFIGCSLRMLLKRIYGAHPVLGQLSHRAMGLLGMGGALAKLARIYCERKKSSKK